jgi:oxygen-independent coproporphyrinogen-3 oxidase
MGPYSVYVHIPFCTHRCAYCDFNTYAGKEAQIPAYVSALCREIELVGSAAPEGLRVHTVYFGGGTPSLLSPRQLGSILGSIRDAFRVEPNPEITVEANPGTVAEEDFGGLTNVGVTRISFGVQSANLEELRLLERTHDFYEVIEAVTAARRAGFDNVNLDLIFGLPGQSLATWQTTVRRVLDLRPEHVSAYALTLENGTPFSQWTRRGLIPAVDPDLTAEMYEWAADTFAAAGLEQYEISNWSRHGFECRHNLQYWRGLPYLGVGAGAHGYAEGIRTANVLRIATYNERLHASRSVAARQEFPRSPATVNSRRQTVVDEMSDTMLMGLRLTQEGVSAETFRRRFATHLLEAYPVEIEELVRHGLVEWTTRSASGSTATSEVLRLTPRGRLLGNRVFLRFVS